jgi:hypothetical protein
MSHLKTIKIKQSHRDFDKDTNRIQNILIDNGFYADSYQCMRLWEMYSEREWASGWTGLPESDSEIFECIKPFFNIID